MGDDHVAERAGLLVEGGAALDVDRLRHVDLDVGDVVAVPDRLEQPVGEPQRQDVLRRLLAEEVIDPVDRLLVEHLVQRGVQLLARWRGRDRTASRSPASSARRSRSRRASGPCRCIAFGGHRQVDESLAGRVDLRFGGSRPRGELRPVFGAGG